MWSRNCDDMLSRFDKMPERDRQTDGQTVFSYINIARKHCCAYARYKLMNKFGCKELLNLKKALIVFFLIFTENCIFMNCLRLSDIVSYCKTISSCFKVLAFLIFDINCQNRPAK